MATQRLVVELHRLDADTVSEVGGKAANLGELLKAGFPVPSGFAVTTAAYAQVAGGLLDDRGPTRMREALLDAQVPAEAADAVQRSYAGLGSDVPVAVRSSATAEDLPWASFAGQQDTFLNVVGAEAVLDAVRRCWASLWTDRAISYRATQGIDHGDVQLAVVVQRMVDAQVAGVLFTADPVVGRRTRTVIDASPGLGEAVVSGAVNPDHIVVEGERTIIEHRLGDKAVEIRPLPGGGTEHVVAAGGAERPSLDEKQIATLVALGRRVEAHFGAPQDIEWALDTGGRAWLTQSRPITTLHPLPTPAGEGLRVFFCFTLAQGLTRPITPMGLAGFRVISSAASEYAFGVPVPDPLAGATPVRFAGGRAWLDITPAIRSDVGRALVPRALDVMESRSAVVLRSLFDDPRLAVRGRSRARFARRLLRTLIRFRIPPAIALSLLNPAAGRRHADRVGDQIRALTTAPANAAPEERLARTVRVLHEGFTIMPRVVPVAGAGFVALGLARALARPELDKTWANDVLRSLPHNSTTEMDLELWELATRLRADADSAAALHDTPPAELARRYRDGAALPPALQEGVARFLARHGHRAVAEIDLGVPRWSDDPTYVLGVLANYLRLEDPELAPDAVFARGARAAETAVTSIVASVRRRSRLRALIVRFALGRVRELAGMRETHKDYLIRVLAHARELIAAIGVDLAGRGLLDDPGDVFFLDLTEARTALTGADHRNTVTTRRQEYERELRRRHVPRVLLSDGTEPEALGTAAPAGEEGALVGTAASAGTVTARARVVLDPVGAHLEPGEILVAPSTDPGWTPLFLTAGGLVMEMGGPNSHGAVVAREYGIPAVVGVPGATTQIETGQLVTVDGAAGVVRVAETPQPEQEPAAVLA